MVRGDVRDHEEMCVGVSWSRHLGTEGHLFRGIHQTVPVRTPSDLLVVKFHCVTQTKLNHTQVKFGLAINTDVQLVTLVSCGADSITVRYPWRASLYGRMSEQRSIHRSNDGRTERNIVFIRGKSTTQRRSFREASKSQNAGDSPRANWCQC